MLNSIRRSIAQLCAKYSVKHWNFCRPLRIVSRYAFWAISEKEVRHLEKWARTGNFIISTERSKGQHVGQALEPTFDLYTETFYGDSAICELVVDDDARVCDPSKMVVGYATSYCALMVRLATGHWMTGKPCDSKGWTSYLAKNGFTEAAKETPILQTIHRSHNHKTYEATSYYIGVLPNVGEHGLVVWTNGMSSESTSYTRHLDGAECEGYTVLCSTYLDGKFKQMLLPNPKYGDVTWVRII